MQGFSATGAGTTPLSTVGLVGPVDINADISVGAGTVLADHATGIISAFRIPGSWEQRSTFVDVPRDAPFAGDIEWLAAEGITSGSWDGRFRPDAPVIRQAMAVFLHDFADRGTTPPVCATSPFRDVPTSSAYCGAVAWLADEGVTRGTADGRFQPLGTVTRQSMAAFLYHLTHEGAAPPQCTRAAFADVPVSSPYCGSIAWLSAQGITTSSPSGAFGPTATVTREMMAAFLHRLDGVLAAG